MPPVTISFSLSNYWVKNSIELMTQKTSFLSHLELIFVYF